MLLPECGRGRRHRWQEVTAGYPGADDLPSDPDGAGRYGAAVGMYDVRCLVSGLVLTGDAMAVLLRRTVSGYQPVTLGIAGTYDHQGSIDGIVEDAGTDLVLDAFVGWIGSGRFVVDADALGVDPEPPRDIEELLWLVERGGLSLGPDAVFDRPVVTLDGEVVAMALIARPVWDALSAAHPTGGVSVRAGFERVFGRPGVAAQIYGDRLTQFAEPVRQLAAVADVLAARGWAWAPPAEPAQRYPTELGMRYPAADRRECLAEARRDLADVAILRAVFDEYEAALAGAEPEPAGDSEPPTGDRLAEISALLEQVSSLQVRTAVAIEAPDPSGGPPG
jgi:hypothetical protein